MTKRPRLDSRGRLGEACSCPLRGPPRTLFNSSSMSRLQSRSVPVPVWDEDSPP